MVGGWLAKSENANHISAKLEFRISNKVIEFFVGGLPQPNPELVDGFSWSLNLLWK